MRSSSQAHRLTSAGLLVGLALGGFFVGILLHQILQWHHLLSEVDAVSDLRFQIVADGLFHALMLVVASIALVMLWKRREILGDFRAGAILCGAALIGFGGWHVIDAVLSHWILGIHRIRGDASNPLMWDLIWVVAFGLAPMFLGARMLRKPGRGGPRRGRAAALSLTLAVMVGGPVTVLPGASNDQTMVVFAPGVSAADAFDALARLDARILWTDRVGGVWLVRLENPGGARQLYRHGALLVSQSTIAPGCLAWTRAA